MNSTMCALRFLILLTTGLASFGATCLAADFIRVRDTATSSILETAVFTYEKNGVKVDLIGAIHLADRSYYEMLNTYFKSFDVVLFEMIGGENLGAKKINAPDLQPEKPNKLAALGLIYGGMEKALGLTGQSSEIDYLAKNFVHADLTIAEFEAAQKARSESLLSFMIHAGINAEKPSHQPNSLHLIRGLISRQPDLVKQELIHTMAAGDTNINSVPSENVIINDRNAKCIRVLNQQITAGKKKIGIFYGAAHLPDLQTQLLAMGFQPASQKWFAAWQIPKK